MNRLEQKVKRLIDVIGSVGLIVLLAPFLFLVSVIIAVDSKGGVLFTQNRVGLNGCLFRVYKFRSMRPYPIDYKNLKEVDARNPHITRIGRLLRSYGIDEIPQLLNILKGDMSFIGPRPTIKEQVDQYTKFQLRRLVVRPGLTGLAQVSGNNSLSWDKRIMLDIWYIDHWSLWLDLRIFIRTISVILKGQVMGQPIEHVFFLPSMEDAQQYAELLELKS